MDLVVARRILRGLQERGRITVNQREQKSGRNLADMLTGLHRRTDRLFFWLLLAQWGFAVALALLISRYGSSGATTAQDSHVGLAIVLGAVINVLPLTLIRLRPASASTRHVVAVAQMSWSALLIHITGGRIETHFHIFGSLAFLAFYRDWRILVTATVVVASEHIARGLFWPESVYGMANPEWWRFLELSGWVVFEDIVLVLGCGRAVQEMRLVADREAELALVNTDIERQVDARTTELRVANESIASEMQAKLRTEGELRQAQKLESVGRLASGVAHEINTPVQFVSDSVHFLRDASKDLTDVLVKLQRVQKSVLDGQPSTEAAQEAAAAAEAADLDYILENIPPAFERTLDGLGRVATIVRSMKDFAHPDSSDMATIDLNRAIESTLIIAKNEYKYVADVETDLGQLPLVMCYVGDVNQAVLNIVVNAAHAIGDVVKGTDKRGKITVRTRSEGENVVIEIQDTGGGIPEAIRERIFDPFFTTKEVGKGTGQGLAIARSVIVDKHKGELTLTSETGVGTTFRLRFPTNGPAVIPELARSA